MDIEQLLPYHMIEARPDQMYPERILEREIEAIYQSWADKDETDNIDSAMYLYLGTLLKIEKSFEFPHMDTVSDDEGAWDIKEIYFMGVGKNNPEVSFSVEGDLVYDDSADGDAPLTECSLHITFGEGEYEVYLSHHLDSYVSRFGDKVNTNKVPRLIYSIYKEPFRCKIYFNGKLAEDPASIKKATKYLKNLKP